ncbi:T9SS type B sorting domain-containing protein [Flavobacterium orientale]|uniref:T9SS C-terminal target domain-containing protein n=1 Tax=Flavobacterium orientale TaxID=1756020 RepID=A0A916Y180_9FLAO|nr:T9SS type B sorting domain-containing protein [Flavobacterium orientale]GGD26488.1 T9SS C-terminal target domain-containing protein [Flavobacterium orientale]
MKKVTLSILFMLFTIMSMGQENCNNGIDDDGDGLIDLNDPDCICQNTTTASFVNNHDFEEINFCPNNFAQFNAATNWFLPSSATTDYINSCGFVPISATDAGIYPLPPSNGNGVAGILVARDYKEFIGICTNTTLVAGTKYQLNFDIASSSSGRTIGNDPNIGLVCNDGVLNAGRIEITLYGRSNCNTSTPPNTNFFPYGWLPLGTANYLPSKNWNQLSIIFTPSINVNSIMLGSPYNVPDTYVDEYDYRSCFPYFYFDNIILNNSSNLGLKINSTGIFCENTLALNAAIDSSIGTGYSFQWYKNGVAIIGATNSILNLNYSTNTVGNYQVKITNSSLCKISPFYNVNTVIDVPDYTIDQSPCFPGTTTVTITTPADEYSFDNGVTWSTNPSKGDLTAFFNPIKILIKKNGCTSSARYVVLISPPLETIYTQPEVIVVQPGCQTNGSITVTTPALEYSFDDGVTWTTNPTLSNLPPNYYHDYKVRIKTLLGCITVAKYVVMMPFRLPEPTVTTTNSGCGIGGTITITTTAQQYSINGGVTWFDNATFSNLSAGSYNVMIKNEFNCISEIKQVFIGTDNLQKPQVTFTQPACGMLGTITVITQAAQYSFDDGVTWSTNNIATDLNPGYHQIKVKDAQNCVSLAEIVYLQTYILAIDIDYSLINSSCTNNGSINILTTAQEYSINDGVTWSSNSSFNNLSPNFYFIKVRNGVNCESNSVLIHLQDFTDISPSYQIANAGCNTYGSITITTVADLYSFDNGLTWDSNNTISNLTGNINYIIVVKNNNCTSQAINVNFNSNYLPNPSVSDYQAYVCDSDNNQVETINLTDYATFLINNHSAYNFYYFTTITDAQNLNLNNQIQNFTSYEILNNQNPVFVTIISPDNCSSIAKIDFLLLATPILSTIPNDVILCENGSVLVNATNNSYSYLWSNGSTSQAITISQPGNYSVTASFDYGNKICSTTKDFTVVLSNAATITSIETQDWTDAENIIIVNTNGFGNYEFSIDGIIYQDSNIFSGLNSGQYTVYVRDKNGCGIAADDIFLLTYPKFFTPNGDGYNDTWAIKFSYYEPNLKVNIFDRYGKLIKTLNNTTSWDGTYNGNELLSSDYWFVVTRENGKEYKGHFSLKR